ncbi:MAG: YfhO family protein [bacterium]
MSARMKDIIVLIIIAFIIIFINFPMLMGFINAKDSITFSYPYFYILKQNINNSSFPLWSHLLNYPIFAESQGGFAHPLHYILTYLLPFWLSHNLSLLIHLLIGSLFLYLYLRFIGLSLLSSLIGSLSFITSSQFSIHLGIMPFIEGASYLPLFLYLVHKAEKGRRLFWHSLFIIVGGISLLCGHFQFALMGIGISLFYIIFISKLHIIKKIGNILIIIFGIISISSIQTFPSLELVRQSERTQDEFDRFYQSYNPLNIITFIDPTFFGEMPHPPAYKIDNNISLKTPNANFWGSGSYFESVYFIGLLPFFLSVLSLFTGFNDEKKRLKWFFITIILIGIFFALGRFNPLAKLTLKLPPLSLFRIPSRYMFLTITSISILSAFGFEALNKNKIRSSYLNLLVISQIVYIILIIIIGLFITREESRLNEFLLMIYGEREGSQLELSKEGYQKKIDILIERAKNSIRISNPDRLRMVFITAIFITAISILRKSKGNIKKITIYFIFLITIVETIHNGILREKVIPYWRFKRPEISEVINPNNKYAIYSSGWDIPLGKEDISTDILIPNTNALFGFTSPHLRLSYEYSIMSRIRELIWTNLYEDGSGEYPITRYKPTTTPKSLKPLEMLSVKYLISTHQIYSERAILINKREYDEIPIYLYLLPSSPLLIYTPVRVIHKKDNNSFQKFITGNEYIAGEDIVFIDGRETSQTLGSSNITIENTTRNEIKLLYEGEGGYIATSILSYPGWECFIDGSPSKIETAFNGLIAIPVIPGSHTVLLKYEPELFKIGLYISALSFIIIVSIITISLGFRKRDEG